MMYDPFNGTLLRTDRPLNPESSHLVQGRTTRTPSIVAALVTPPRAHIVPRLERQTVTRSLSLPDLLVTWYGRPDPRHRPRPLYALNGYGLLPFDPATGRQYVPTAPAHLLEAWRGREVCPASGHVEGLRNQSTPVVTLAHPHPVTGALTRTRLHRARIVAAAAMCLHPLTPVMAWYIADPETHGYGIDNVYTPLHAGTYHFEPLAEPPAPHEMPHPTATTQRRPRYVYTPWTHADEWPFPTPADVNAFFL